MIKIRVRALKISVAMVRGHTEEGVEGAEYMLMEVYT